MKRRGPRTEPWGTPVVTGDGWELKDWAVCDIPMKIKEDSVRDGVEGRTQIEEDENSEETRVGCHVEVV